MEYIFPLKTVTTEARTLDLGIMRPARCRLRHGDLSKTGQKLSIMRPTEGEQIGTRHPGCIVMIWTVSFHTSFSPQPQAPEQDFVSIHQYERQGTRCKSIMTLVNLKMDK